MTLRRREPEQRRGIAAENFCLVRIRDRRLGEPLGSHGIGDERPVDGEQDAVDAHFGDAAGERRVGKVAARGQVEMLAENLAERIRLVAGARQRLVDTPEQEWNAFAEMAEDELQTRVLVEQAE